MAVSPAEKIAAQLGRETRERFLLEVCRALPGITTRILENLTAQMGQSGTTAEMQLRRDAWSQFQIEGTRWRDLTVKAWQQYLAKPATNRPTNQPVRIKLELQDQDVVESRIVVSRFVEAVMEDISQEFNTLRMRMKELEGIVDLAPRDILRPDVLVSMMLEQWSAVGMPEGSWALVHSPAKAAFGDALLKACEKCNEFLAQRGILPRGFKQVRVVSRPVVSLNSGADYVTQGLAQRDGRRTGARPSSFGPASIEAARGIPGGVARAAPGWVSGSNLADVVKINSLAPSLELAVIRAQGVIGQLKSLLQHRVADFDSGGRPQNRSKALARALEPKPQPAVEAGWEPTEHLAFKPQSNVKEVAEHLRDDTSELKKVADSDSEKAVIEVVALMFQSILTEDRIPSSIRIWVARLQMPVLRIALAEPEFFDSLDHPARLLIDRIGSCVMGFDVATINGSELETEVKRVVQVIEQYPETGHRVFQKVYDEFLKFLSGLLTGKGATQRVVSVVQQVDQKETLAIKYTIELRNMLKDIPVRDEIRQFLFKVWADVLAVASMRFGPMDEQTHTFKRVATDLVWSASAKASRSARTRVIQALPGLLQNLRDGMALLGLNQTTQDAHIKIVSDTLADAFMSKTETITYVQIEAMTRQLARLEDVVPPDGMGDLPLDAESIEMMLGIDASSLVVVADGGAQPSPDIVNWAKSLAVGTWFTLNHMGATIQVQFAWRSDKQKLHLFAAPSGQNYLIQAGRLAGYLQAGLLTPLEDETLTVRATREALAQLEANPDRLVT